MTVSLNGFKRAANKILRPLQVQLAMNARISEMASKAKMYDQISEIVSSTELTDEAKVFLCNNISSSYSQICQDLFAVLVNKDANNLYFVEFGAAGGKVASNTFLLENKFNWNGIVAEPARTYRKELIENRKCIKDFRCVYSESGKSLEFIESKTSMLSTISGFEKKDFLGNDRKVRKKYLVQTISLIDLLRESNAPKSIGYLSIDTEGSEYKILEGFDFNEYSFNFISVEHNTPTQEKRIEESLTSKGYRRILKDLSKFDSWYILSSSDVSQILKEGLNP